MSRTGSGSGWGWLFLASWASECAPQPWSQETTRPSSLACALAHTPNTCDSGPASRTRNPQDAQRRGGRLRQRRLGPVAAVVPALGGQVAALEGEHAGAAEAELVDDLAHAVLVDDLVAGVAGEVAGHQPRVVLLGGQQVAGAEVAGLDAVAVGQPVRRDDRLVAGSSTTSSTVTVLRRGARATVTAQRQPR